MKAPPVCMPRLLNLTDQPKLSPLASVLSTSFSPLKSLYQAVSTASAWQSPQEPLLPAARPPVCTGTRWGSRWWWRNSNYDSFRSGQFSRMSIWTSLWWIQTWREKSQGPNWYWMRPQESWVMTGSGILGTISITGSYLQIFLEIRWVVVGICQNIDVITQPFSGELLRRLLRVHPAVCPNTREWGTIRWRSPCGNKCKTRHTL